MPSTPATSVHKYWRLSEVPSCGIDPRQLADVVLHRGDVHLHVRCRSPHTRLNGHLVVVARMGDHDRGVVVAEGHVHADGHLRAVGDGGVARAAIPRTRR
jgi:hypothetical protein